MCFFATGTKIEKILIEKNFNKMEKWILRVYFTNSLFHDEILNKDFMDTEIKSIQHFFTIKINRVHEFSKKNYFIFILERWKKWRYNPDHVIILNIA